MSTAPDTKPEPTNADPAGRDEPGVLRILTAIACLISFIALFFPPAVIGDTYEWSWALGIEYLARHHFREGVDWIFTYGPLGGLSTGIYMPGFFMPIVIWHILLTSATVYCLYRFSRRIERPWLRIAFILLASIPANVSKDAWFDELLLLVGLNALLEDAPGPLDVVFLAVIASALLLTKLTLAAPALLIAFLLQYKMARPGGKVNPVLWSPILWMTVVTAGMWLALGQRAGDFPAFVRSSLAESTGYNAALSYDGPLHELIPGLLAFAALMFCCLTIWRRQDRQPARIDVALFAAAMLFVVWKHGFLRHDGPHITIFFCIALLLCGVMIPAFRPSGRARALAIAAIAVAAVVSLPPLLLARIAPFGQPHHRLSGIKPWVAAELHGMVDHPRDVLETLLTPGAIERRDRQAYATVAASSALPGLRVIIGNASVDVFSQRIGVAIVNGLNYQPRLALQAYNANDRLLTTADAAHYAGSDAPAFILLQLATTDDHILTLDDGPAFDQILARYRIVDSEGGFLLLRRETTANNGPAFGPPTIVDTDLNAWVSAPSNDSTYTYATIHLRHTPIYALRSFLFKPPTIYVALRFADGSKQIKRIVPPGIDDGFLLSPYVSSNDDFAALKTGRPLPRVVSMRVLPEPQLSLYVHGPVTYTFRKSAPFARP